jgi:eukaryotic-like serine/threonine-protein kinase
VAEATTIGQVITFYSYKGGTGRSMSLANVACLLAERRLGRVLLVDWDLEAPGLHRFFPGRAATSASDTSLGLDGRQGLLDLFRELDAATPTSLPASEEEAEQRAAAALDTVGFENFVLPAGVSGIYLLRAGRDEDGHYAERVATFNWEGLFRRSPSLFRALADRWSRNYRYVLIDSRTGVGDISGICTSLLPDKLVVVFTPNRQSLTGIRSLVERATKYRRQSDDLRPLTVFPLPSRIEATREDLRVKWRFGDAGNGIIGYQPMFEDILSRTYGLPECKLGLYFDSVQIQQSPDYAYGENIAVRTEIGTDRFSLGSSYRVFTDWLVNAPGPWRRQLEVDTLLDTLKERVEAEPAGSEQRRGLEEIVGRLEESVKVTTTSSQAPSPVRLTIFPDSLRFFLKLEAFEEISEAVRAGRYVRAYTHLLVAISQSVVLPLVLVYFAYRGISDIVTRLIK